MDWLEKIEEFDITPADGDTFEPLTEDEILNIERIIGSEFPNDYRMFLKKFGASDFGEMPVFPTEGGGVYPGLFFGKELEKMIHKYDERLPKLIVPINDDGANNLICISLREHDYGKIYFQNHSIGLNDNEDDIEIAKSNTMAFIAKDFASFIKDLVIE